MPLWWPGGGACDSSPRLVEARRSASDACREPNAESTIGTASAGNDGFSRRPLAEFDMSNLNDPRVFFAAERTLLAWNRTSLTLMAFGFMIERFGLFIQMLGVTGFTRADSRASFWIGLSFVLLGAFSAGAAVVQYRRVLRTLKPIEIPEGYRVNLGVFVNLAVAALGLCLSAYLFARAFK